MVEKTQQPAINQAITFWLVTYTVPQPSNPRLWNIVTQHWKRKTKKNMKKLN